jgi:hypothetical protein
VAVSGLVVEAGELGVGAVDPVAGGAEVVADGAEVSAAGDAVLHEAGGLWLVGVGELAWMRSWVFSAGLIVPVLAKQTRPWAKTSCCGRAASQMARRRAVTWSTLLPRPSAAAMPSPMSRS